MKIVFYINTMKAGGGAERVVARLANYLSNLSHNVTVITIERNIDEYSIDSAVRRVVLDDEIRIRNAWFRIACLRRYCVINEPDILISFAEGASEFAVIATMLLKQKLIVSIRNAPEHDFPTIISRLTAKLLLPLSDGAVFQTETIRDWFPRRMRCKSAIILNPIEENLCNYKWEPVKNRIVTIGRITEQKNQKILIEAFSKIKIIFTDAELYIFGRGDKENEIKKLIEGYGLDDSVYLMGYEKNIHDFLKKANIFVLPSYIEGLPNALMEAMAIGVPSVATDCIGGGAKELLGENEYGILVNNNDAVDLEKGISQLLQDDNLQRTYSNLSKEKSRNFGVHLISNEWIEYIEKVVYNI